MYASGTLGESSPGPTELAAKSLEKIEAITAEVKALKGSVEAGVNVTCTSGCTGGGGGGGGEVEVTSFKSGANKELSELRETTEVVGFCIVGTLLAISLSGFVVLMLRTRK
jgi:hypothetical protein